MAKWPYTTARWQRLRLAKLADRPTCEVCARRGKTVPATHVDHRLAIRSGGEIFPPLDGLMSMCASCHSVKTNARDNPYAFGDRERVAFKGCDIDGNPIDDAHPFHAGETGGASDHGGSGAGTSGRKLRKELS